MFSELIFGQWLEKSAKQSTTSSLKSLVKQISLSAATSTRFITPFLPKSLILQCRQANETTKKKTTHLATGILETFLHGQMQQAENQGVSPSPKEVINLSLGDYHTGHFRQLFQPWRFGQPASNEDVLMLNAA